LIGFFSRPRFALFCSPEVSLASYVCVPLTSRTRATSTAHSSGIKYGVHMDQSASVLGGAAAIHRALRQSWSRRLGRFSGTREWRRHQHDGADQIRPAVPGGMTLIRHSAGMAANWSKCM
jgi:hypothetical protein